MVDGVLLPKLPEEMLAEKNFNNVPYMVGINKQEFGWIIPLVRKLRPCRLVSQHITLPSLVTDLSLGPGQLSPSYS
jgi:carboxylesterase 1